MAIPQNLAEFILALLRTNQSLSRRLSIHFSIKRYPHIFYAFEPALSGLLCSLDSAFGTGLSTLGDACLYLYTMFPRVNAFTYSFFTIYGMFLNAIQVFKLIHITMIRFV